MRDLVINKTRNFRETLATIPEVPILLAIPIFMSIVNTSWLYTAVGYLDPWYNVAYFLHYNDPTFSNDYYKISRLSWIIPGYVAYLIFTPIVANYILHMGALCVSIVALYASLRKLFNRELAFLVSALFAVYVPFHGSGGWDYQTTPSGAYYLLTFYCITNAVFFKRKYLWLFMSGIAYGATLHADILFINMLPILAFHYFFTAWARKGEPIRFVAVVGQSGCVVFGIFLITIALGTINFAVGRDFFFFKPLANLVFSFVTQPSHSKAWWLPWNTRWYLNNGHLSYLALPLAVLSVSVTVLTVATVWRKAFDLVALSLLGQFVFVGALWIIWQSQGQTALQPQYFAYPLIPPMFGAVGGLSALQLDRPGLTRGAFYFFIAAIVVAPLCIGHIAVFLTTHIAVTSPSILLILSLLAGCTFLVLNRNYLFAAIAVAIFSLCNFVNAATTGSNFYYTYGQPCEDRASIYRALIDANRFLTAFDSNLHATRVWWSDKETLWGQHRRCNLRMALFGFSMASFGANYLAEPWSGMPTAAGLPETVIKSVDSRNEIAVPTADPAVINRLTARFKSSGVTLTVTGKTIIRSAPFKFYVFILARKPH